MKEITSESRIKLFYNVIIGSLKKLKDPKLVKRESTKISKCLGKDIKGRKRVCPCKV